MLSSDSKFVPRMKSDISVAVLISVLKLFSNFDVVHSLIHRDYTVHERKNLTISCSGGDSSFPTIWTSENRNISSQNVVFNDSTLTLLDVTSDDAGTYVCSKVKNASVSQSYQEHIHAHVRVRTRPGAVGSFRARATTIIAVLIWEVWRNRTGGVPIIDFTAEMRRLPEVSQNDTEDEEEEWELIDPHHITPNARYLEVYHLKPNTSYQFRIWANNEVGPGDKCTITARTIEPTQEKDLILKILEDAKNFDTRVWIAAVAIVMGTLLILTCGTCLVLYKECQEYSGFCDTDDNQRAPLSPIKTTHYYGYGSDEFEKENATFSRKMSIFFTGNTIKRI